MNKITQLAPVLKWPAALDEDAKSHINYNFNNPNTNTPYVNSTLQGQPARGVLGGSVACVSPLTGKVTICNAPLNKAVGLFGLNAAGEDLESNRPTDSSVITILSNGLLGLSVYETVSFLDNATELSYQPDDLLYVSAFGFLTKEISPVNYGNPVALVVEVPDSSGQMKILLYDHIPASPTLAPLRIQTFVEHVEMTPALYDQKYHVLQHEPVDPTNVFVHMFSGNKHHAINKDTFTVGTFLPNFQMDSNEPKHLYFRNAVAGEHGTNEEHSGLDEFTNNNSFTVTYQYYTI